MESETERLRESRIEHYQQAGLSEQQAEIQARLDDFMSQAEVARDMDIPQPQVSQQVSRVEKKLQKAQKLVGLMMDSEEIDPDFFATVAMLDNYPPEDEESER